MAINKHINKRINDIKRRKAEIIDDTPPPVVQSDPGDPGHYGTSSDHWDDYKNCLIISEVHWNPSDEQCAGQEHDASIINLTGDECEAQFEFIEITNICDKSIIPNNDSTDGGEHINITGFSIWTKYWEPGGTAVESHLNWANAPYYKRFEFDPTFSSMMDNSMIGEDWMAYNNFDFQFDGCHRNEYFIGKRDDKNNDDTDVPYGVDDGAEIVGAYTGYHTIVIASNAKNYLNSVYPSWAHHWPDGSSSLHDSPFIPCVTLFEWEKLQTGEPFTISNERMEIQLRDSDGIGVISRVFICGDPNGNDCKDGTDRDGERWGNIDYDEDGIMQTNWQSPGDDTGGSAELKTLYYTPQGRNQQSEGFGGVGDGAFPHPSVNVKSPGWKNSYQGHDKVRLRGLRRNEDGVTYRWWTSAIDVHRDAYGEHRIDFSKTFWLRWMRRQHICVNPNLNDSYLGWSSTYSYEENRNELTCTTPMPGESIYDWPIPDYMDDVIYETELSFSHCGNCFDDEYLSGDNPYNYDLVHCGTCASGICEPDANQACGQCVDPGTAVRCDCATDIRFDKSSTEDCTGGWLRFNEPVDGIDALRNMVIWFDLSGDDVSEGFNELVEAGTFGGTPGYPGNWPNYRDSYWRPSDKDGYSYANDSGWPPSPYTNANIYGAAKGICECWEEQETGPKYYYYGNGWMECARKDLCGDCGGPNFRGSSGGHGWTPEEESEYCSRDGCPCLSILQLAGYSHAPDACFGLEMWDPYGPTPKTPPEVAIHICGWHNNCDGNRCNPIIPEGCGWAWTRQVHGVANVPGNNFYNPSECWGYDPPEGQSPEYPIPFVSYDWIEWGPDAKLETGTASNPVVQPTSPKINGTLGYDTMIVDFTGQDDDGNGGGRQDPNQPDQWEVDSIGDPVEFLQQGGRVMSSESSNVISSTGKSLKRTLNTNPNLPPTTRNTDCIETGYGCGESIEDRCVKISEVHWNPSSGLQGSDEDFEFVEITNTCNWPVNLYKWKIRTSSLPYGLDPDVTWPGNTEWNLNDVSIGGVVDTFYEDNLYTRYYFKEDWYPNEPDNNSMETYCGGYNYGYEEWRTPWERPAWWLDVVGTRGATKVIASKANTYIDWVGGIVGGDHQGDPIPCLDIFEFRKLNSGAPFTISNNDMWIGLFNDDGILVDKVFICGGSDCPDDEGGLTDDWQTPGDATGGSAELQFEYIYETELKKDVNYFNESSGYVDETFKVKQPRWISSMNEPTVGPEPGGILGGTPGFIPHGGAHQLVATFSGQDFWNDVSQSFCVDIPDYVCNALYGWMMGGDVTNPQQCSWDECPDQWWDYPGDCATTGEVPCMHVHWPTWCSSWSFGGNVYPGCPGYCWSGAPECGPTQVEIFCECYERDIEILSLPDSNDVRGPIPANIAKLTNLRSLNLSSNWSHEAKLVGPIPYWIGYMKNLENINLAGNELSGHVPASLLRLAPQLVELDLHNNKLSGNANILQMICDANHYTNGGISSFSVSDGGDDGYGKFNILHNRFCPIDDSWSTDYDLYDRPYHHLGYYYDTDWGENDNIDFWSLVDCAWGGTSGAWYQCCGCTDANDPAAASNLYIRPEPSEDNLSEIYSTFIDNVGRKNHGISVTGPSRIKEKEAKASRLKYKNGRWIKW